MTTAAICEIVTALHRLGIGMAEAKVFVIADGKTMREIANQGKSDIVFTNNKLWALTQKGLITQSGRPATYNHTADGQKAMKSLIAAGMKK